MKGVVFNLLEAAVERNFGPDTWDALLDQAGVSGSYTSLGNYPDEEIEALVAAAGEALSMDRNAVLRWFGVQAIPVLVELYPGFFSAANSRAFLDGINSIIHAEVRKIYPGAQCPHFRLHVNGTGDLVMDYLSTRQMCALGQGFVEGTAAWYGEQVTFTHTACTQHGAAHCTFEIHWDDAQAAVPAVA